MWGTSFKVELLHAKSLPCHLLHSLSGVLRSNDSMVLEAAIAHLRDIADHLDFLRGIDYSEKEAELEALSKATEWDSFPTWDSADLEKGTYVAWQVQSYR